MNLILPIIKIIINMKLYKLINIQKVEDKTS